MIRVRLRRLVDGVGVYHSDVALPCLPPVGSFVQTGGAASVIHLVKNVVFEAGRDFVMVDVGGAEISSPAVLTGRGWRRGAGSDLPWNCPGAAPSVVTEEAKGGTG